LKRAAKAVEEFLRTLSEKQVRKATLCWEIDEQILIEANPEAKPESISEIEHRRVMPHLKTWNRFADLEARHEEARRVSASMEPFFWRKPLSNS
jgi:hypothetical protein